MPLSLDWTTLGFVAFAVGVSYSLAALAKVVARRIGFLDYPDGFRKLHPNPVPLLGGLAVYGSVLISTLIACFWCRWDRLISGSQMNRVTLLLLVSAGLMCAVGLWDDWKPLRPRVKFALQIVACLPFVLWGHSVQTMQLFDARIELGILGPIFTVFWLVGCANSINLLDGLDGLAGTVGLILSLATAVLSTMHEAGESLALALIFGGALLGFLLHNWPPARIYLGDSGSLTIGLIVGVLAMESSTKKVTGFALGIPVVLVSVPVFDTLMAVLRRKLTGKGIGEPDRGHIHHCFQNRGLSHAQSLIAISGLCAVMALLALFSAYFQNDRLAIGLCLFLLFVLIVGRIFGFDETVQFFRALQAVSLLMARRFTTAKTPFDLEEAFGDGAGTGAFILTEPSGQLRSEEPVRALHLHSNRSGARPNDFRVRSGWVPESPGADDLLGWQISCSIVECTEQNARRPRRRLCLNHSIDVWPVDYTPRT
jgi:UDP-GlcNAc:undecaprenyl-phosphate GlcNAc-1-phosphate transferase